MSQTDGVIIFTSCCTLFLSMILMLMIGIQLFSNFSTMTQYSRLTIITSVVYYIHGTLGVIFYSTIMGDLFHSN